MHVLAKKSTRLQSKYGLKGLYIHNLSALEGTSNFYIKLLFWYKLLKLIYIGWPEPGTGGLWRRER